MAGKAHMGDELRMLGQDRAGTFIRGQEAERLEKAPADEHRVARRAVCRRGPHDLPPLAWVEGGDQAGMILSLELRHVGERNEHALSRRVDGSETRSDR